MYDRILVPTDGSTGTAHVALHALELAEQHGATVYAINVIDSSITSYLGNDDDAANSLDAQAQNAVGMVERMAESYGIACETAVREGDPADTILTYATDIDADLIVAGTHGRSGVKRHLLGSVTERLVRHADAPVLTVSLPETDVTVEDATHARDLIDAALADAGHDVEALDVERQLSVWVGRGETAEGSVVVYLDPTTQRTSVLQQ
jgi:nucleotide-binding universal stress UspA family protein